jgi:DNA-binding MarR family transcriptional regulator
MAEDNMKEESEKLVQRILKLSEDIYRAVRPVAPHDWLTSELTIAQLRVLLVLYSEGASRMGSIASSLGVAVSTATGVVDNMVRKGLVTRGNVPEDRRLVICALSSQGRETVNRLWATGRFQIEKLLQGLSIEQLKKAEEVAEFLLVNVKGQHNLSVG